MGNLFIVRFTYCHFDETKFPSLGITKGFTYEKQKNIDTFSWNEKSLSHLGLHTLEYEMRSNALSFAGNYQQNT